MFEFRDTQYTQSLTSDSYRGDPGLLQHRIVVYILLKVKGQRSPENGLIQEINLTCFYNYPLGKKHARREYLRDSALLEERYDVVIIMKHGYACLMRRAQQERG